MSIKCYSWGSGSLAPSGYSVRVGSPPLSLPQRGQAGKVFQRLGECLGRLVGGRYWGVGGCRGGDQRSEALWVAPEHPSGEARGLKAPDKGCELCPALPSPRQPLLGADTALCVLGGHGYEGVSTPIADG